MKDKIFKYGIPLGLIISCIGFILLKTDLIDLKVYGPFYNIYQLTLFISVIFVFINSTFINQKFNQFLKIIGTTFFVILGLNLLKEFNVYEVKGIEIISSITIVSLLVLYFFHFYRKPNRNTLDILKLGFVLFAVMGAFFKIFEITPENFKYFTGGLFWFSISGMILFNYSDRIKERISN
jgi:hypothetical protein